MRKIYFLFFCLLGLATSSLHAQNCEIPLAVVIPEQIEPLPAEARQYLKDKLTQIAVSNGISANRSFTQFMLTAKVTLLSKDILPGPPRKISQTMSISFYIVDYFGEKVLASRQIEVQSVGTNENKVYIEGVRNIHAKNKDIQAFIQEGKEKIISYYDANYPNLIKKAKHLAAMKEYEEALFLLTSVPECSKGYDTSIASCQDIYLAYVNHSCQTNLNKAKAVWLSNQDVEGAGEAAIYLSRIYPDASCYREAMELYKEIKNRIRENWTFEMKQYNDDVSLQKQRINAYKEIGVAFGNGQKPVTTNIGRLY